MPPSASTNTTNLYACHRINSYMGFVAETNPAAFLSCYVLVVLTTTALGVPFAFHAGRISSLRNSARMAYSWATSESWAYHRRLTPYTNLAERFQHGPPAVAMPWAAEPPLELVSTPQTICLFIVPDAPSPCLVRFCRRAGRCARLVQHAVFLGAMIEGLVLQGWFARMYSLCAPRSRSATWSCVPAMQVVLAVVASWLAAVLVFWVGSLGSYVLAVGRLRGMVRRVTRGAFAVVVVDRRDGDGVE